MKNMIKAAMLAATCLAIGGCKVNKTQEGKLPSVEVNASGGQLPEYNVQGPEVNVGMENKTVEVPTVHVAPAGKK
jgi:hypothetical protein